MVQQTRQTAKPLKLQAPRQLTPFIGRQQELADLALLLNNPTCRLLTLVGPGGVGKTRLAIQAATQVAGDFTHGVSFVPLQSVQSTDFLVSAIADALDVPLTGQAEPIVQLLHYLHSKEILLALDNFEQLLAPLFPPLRGGRQGRVTYWLKFLRPPQKLNSWSRRGRHLTCKRNGFTRWQVWPCPPARTSKGGQAMTP